MLKNLLENLRKSPVLPVLPHEKAVEPLQAANLLAVLPVLPVLREKTESKRKAFHNTDNRHYCRECLKLRNGYCTKQRFKPVDDIPRRCGDFTRVINPNL